MTYTKWTYAATDNSNAKDKNGKLVPTESTATVGDWKGNVICKLSGYDFAELIERAKLLADAPRLRDLVSVNDKDA